ncbi:MAG: hypothetical protein AAGH76_09580 [Pseudomonadota bacterium]
MSVQSLVSPALFAGSDIEKKARTAAGFFKNWFLGPDWNRGVAVSIKERYWRIAPR